MKPKKIYLIHCCKSFVKLLFVFIFLFVLLAGTYAQTCPTAIDGALSSFPNTYYPGESSPAAGATTIILGAVPSGYGTTPIAAGDILLIIQMQGAQINSSNSGAYGSNGSSGNGYLNNAGLLAGTMEYGLAQNAVPLTGGTLVLNSGLVNSYQRSVYGTYGQYTYQVIRVPYYNNLILNANISPPAWNDSLGGVMMLDVKANLNFNGKVINASGLGFRGGAGVSLAGAGSSSYTYTDYLTTSSVSANGSKGEGIAGTPKYLNNNGALLGTSTTPEGYPGGSYASGAPGNAAGGGTDGYPLTNAQNAGGGGGGNGGGGGRGGNSFFSNNASGGKPGVVFSQVSPSRMVLGGGGGAGTSNNATGTPTLGFASSGSAGGGMVIIITNSISGTGTITANGSDITYTPQNDGSGGGGAGGSVLVFSQSSLSGLTITANGGKGGSNLPYQVNQTYHGPGGGGGGGVIYSNYTLNAASSVNGGTNGTSTGVTSSTNTTPITSNYNAAAGSSGILNQSVTGTQLPQTLLPCTSLPVILKKFFATRQGMAVNIYWVIENEINYNYFAIEYSTDGINFSTIGNVQSEEGKTSYTFIHQSPQPGTDFYRLKMIDASGKYIYSNIVPVNFNEADNDQFIIYPNPATTSFTLQYHADNAGQLSIDLFDMNGRKLITKNFNAEKGQNYFYMPDISSLSKGMYLIKVNNGSKIVVRKLVINK